MKEQKEGLVEWMNYYRLKKEVVYEKEKKYADQRI